jgi:tetratricopeptide (TPR) repeat protein
MAEKQPAPAQGRQPLSPVVRRRVQQCFQYGSKAASQSNFDYATEMFARCVTEDPGNIIYIQNFMGNLQKKYNNNKKGSKLAGIRGAGAKGSLKKAGLQKDPMAVVKAGIEVLKHNPWDVPTLVAMAHACERLELDEAQLAYLKSALDFNIKDPEVNRLAGKALASMGDFDQAIVCWTRVVQAKPGDEEAKHAIGNLTVERTISKGGYEAAETTQDVRSRDEEEDDAPVGVQYTPVQLLERAIEKDPTDQAHYLQLADLHRANHRFGEAGEILERALQASGGDLNVRERMEDVQLEAMREKVSIAESKYRKDQSEANANLYRKMMAELNRSETDVFRVRCERYPNHLGFRYELGLRLQRAGKIKEAIPEFQTALADKQRKGHVMLALGKCFQKIKQYKLAMNNYRSAVENLGEEDQEARKQVLYLTGQLALYLKDLDAAEQYLSDLANIDFAYKDVAGLLEKVSQARQKGAT